MKSITTEFAGYDTLKINNLEIELTKGSVQLPVDGVIITITSEDVEILSEDIPGWLVATEGKLTVALDVTLTAELIQEGIAREFINRIQNLRKDNGYDVTDKINIQIQKHDAIIHALTEHKQYIATQTLALDITLVDVLNDANAREVEIDDTTKTLLKITRIE